MIENKAPPFNQTLEAYKQLSYSKQDRKRIEEDARILANRIALLKYEDEKTLKKIDETRLKANQIYNMKIMHDERQQKKKKKIFVDIDKLKENILKQKTKSLMKKRKVKSTYDKFYQENAQKIRSESQLNDQKKAKQLQKQNKIQYLQTQLIRQQNEITKKKVEEHYQVKKLQNQCSLIQQSNENESIKIKRENEINRMESVEVGLINKLQKSQAIQKLAFIELENALALPHQEFASKYKSKTKKNLKEKSNQDTTLK